MPGIIHHNEVPTGLLIVAALLAIPFAFKPTAWNIIMVTTVWLVVAVVLVRRFRSRRDNPTDRGRSEE